MVGFVLAFSNNPQTITVMLAGYVQVVIISSVDILSFVVSCNAHTLQIIVASIESDQQVSKNQIIPSPASIPSSYLGV